MIIFEDEFKNSNFENNKESINSNKPDENDPVITPELSKDLAIVLKYVGKHNDTPDDDFDAEQLAKGIDVEMEHTGNKVIAKAITKDHLTECDKYYEKLADLEKSCKKSD